MELINLSKISSEEILAGSFGIEWESLRVKSNGELALTPHPSVFGDKLKNPVVTTDFSESQVEIITPAFDTVDEAFDTFSALSDVVNSSLPEGEYLWFQSLPCILPSPNQIPIAQYSQEGEESQKYRENLASKYGVKKQLISGVHFNFSFDDGFIEKLRKITKSDLSFRQFRDEIYLKITRNYLRYCWLIIYLTGCSIGAHESFSSECINLMDMQDGFGGYYSTKGPSFRNASSGYKNLKKLYPSYNSISEFTRDVTNFIDNGDLSEAKELYTQIRLKPKNPSDVLNSLNETGIEYIEIRTLDINPFYKCGLVKHDMKFLHLFLIYMFVKNESDYPDWQREANINEERVAERAFDESMRLLKDGNEVTLKEWAYDLINEMYGMCDVFDINEYNTLKLMHDRVLNPELTPGKKLLKLIKRDGFINAHMFSAITHKQTSKNLIKNVDKEEYGRLKKYLNIALYRKKSDKNS
ncbi:glutamate--cysteine ligase [Methanobrevibacter gottschalkii]|uniref:glutamate--cysteine ligase n=2 Tax=Methanobrevibacter gottschalkii TaxID=190974 RepID=A0A3N5B3P9_9EURY|nr:MULTISPECIES: glutamate--cysteine ligase [Methanobrevibacter]MCQ2971114.1 glutamate--cysteine ligase [archaeon]OEC99556.1 glutamate--cysteine ligase [Methanobrevibacter sp. A27]RPF51699.1 glutamate--cysteine ligase [Methanobrevibacter gottschalkii DSM 11977]SEL03917.1 glutamate--cysteine ligase [Methanobrevibacter gottschalkii]